MYGHQYVDQLADQQTQKDKLKGDSRKLELANSRLQAEVHAAAELNGGEASLPIDEAFSRTLIGVRQESGAYGVTVGAITPHKKTGGSGLTNLTAMTEHVPGTKVNSTRLNVRGSYTDYEGFARYLSSLGKYPLSVVYLKVSDKNYELGLRIYGL
jgi:hypothetical protein